MEGFGNSSLYCNFNPPSKKKATPKKTHSKAKQHLVAFTSPDPTVKSPIYDEELVNHEDYLNRREEDFLIDLKLFYEGIDRFNRTKMEYEQLYRNKKQGTSYLVDFASKLSLYQDMLEQRYEAAQQVLAEPCTDYEKEVQIVEELENEIEEMNNFLADPNGQEKQFSMQQMLRELDMINSENERNNRRIFEKQNSTEKEGKRIDDELSQLEKMENEEKRQAELLQQEMKELESLPQIDVEHAIQNEKRKLELEKRKQQNEQNQLEFEQKRRNFDNEVIQLNNEILKLDKEKNECEELDKKTDDIIHEIETLKEKSGNPNEIFAKMDDEIAGLNRTIDNQKAERTKIESQKENIKRKWRETEELEVKLKERQAQLKKRRDELSNSNELFIQQRAELDGLKKQIDELNEEVKKNEKLVKDKLDECSNVQEQLDSLSREHSETSIKSHLDELHQMLSSEAEKSKD